MRQVFSRRFALFLAPLCLVAASPYPAAAAPLSWTDWADLALAGPVVLIGDVASISRFSPKAAPDVPPGEVRARVEVKLRAVLKSPSVFPEKASWIWQGGAVGGNKTPFAKGNRVLAFGALEPSGRKPEIQPIALVARSGQQPWSAASEATVRAILTEALRKGVGNLMVTGIADGFHSEGDTPGAGESQFFLTTTGGNPMVLVVRRKGGAAPPELLASTGELVADAEPVARDTLPWRALSCGLPSRLPERLIGNLALVEDYLVARLMLGPCDRTLSTFRAKEGAAAGTAGG